MHGHTSLSRREKTDCHQLSADPGCDLEDLQKVMDDEDSWRERERERERGEGERERELKELVNTNMT